MVLGSKPTRHRRRRAPALAAGVLALLVAGAVAAAGTALRQRTASYDVRLGVVSARDLRVQPKLLDAHKTLHGGLEREPGTQHVTVAVYAAGSERRVLDATVIAEVRYKKWFGGERIEKPLERMEIDGTITYGNFFFMPAYGDYEITARVYATNAGGPEVARFAYRRAP